MIKELVEKRARLAEENAGLLAKAQKDGRDVLNAEEEQEWQSRDAAIDALGKNITMRQKQERVAAALAEVEPRQTVTTDSPGETRTSAVALRQLERGQADAELALRAWFLAGTDRPLTEEHRAAASRVGIDLHNRMFSFNLRSRPPKTVAEAVQGLERRAQTITTTGGGYLIPDEMMQSFEKALLWYGGMREAATVIRTESGAAMPFPTANDTGNVGVILDINTQVANQDVTFGQMVLGAFKYSSKQILVPVELMQDSAFDLPSMLGEMLGERIGRIQNTHFTVGAGTTLPWGIAVRATSGSAPTGTVAAGFTYVDLVNTEHSVDIAYRRQGAAWMMSDVQLARFKKLLDGSNRPLWQPALSGLATNNPDNLLGYPVIINNDLVSTQTNGSRVVLFGAFRKYIIRDVLGVTLLRLDERYADYHQVAFLAFARADGDLLNAGTNPVKYLQYTT